MPDVKKIISIIGLSAVLALNPGLAFAQSSPAGSPASRRLENQETRLTRLHARCDQEVNVRINNLNGLNTAVGNLKKLPSAQISQFQNEIQTDINGLTSLKAKCDADTDAPTLISDIKSIFTNFRVYAVFMPQVRLLAAADRMGVTVDLFSDYANKLQYRINQQGNPANLTALLTDMNAKIADAKTQYTNVINLISPLSPSSFPGSNPTLKSARTDLKTGYADLRAAFQDSKQIRQGLKSLGGTSITSSPSPTSTP